MSKNQNKTVQNDGSVNEFLTNISDDQRRKDSIELDKLIQSVTGERPHMWGSSIVGYGNYHYKYESGREGDFMKVGFSPRKASLSLYIMPGFKRFDQLMSKLGRYTTGKSCLYIKKMDDIDRSVLKELIEDSYQHMSKKYG